MEPPSLEAIATPPTLEYEKAYVNFIYSFSWDVTKISFKDLAEELAPPPPKPPRKHQWTLDQLHQRYLDFDGNTKSYGAYRPSLLTGCQNALYYTPKDVSNELEVITPLGEGWTNDERLVKTCRVSLKYYLRFLENGAGICTLSLCLRERSATFENIHGVLHLGDNLSFGPRKEETRLPHVCSYLRMCKDCEGDRWIKNMQDYPPVPVRDRNGTEVTMRFYRKRFVNGEELPENVFSMQEMVNTLLLTNDGRLPNGWVTPKDPADPKSLKTPDPSYWLDWELLDWPAPSGKYEINYPWQNPYVFTICELGKPTKGERFSAQAVVSARAREIASMLTKMNLNNDRIGKDFQCMGDDYVSHALPYNKKKKALRNLSHDDRLFFTFSRRGALALTARMDQIPGYFVLPSFVNLLEILRARWHLGNVVNLELDAAIEKLVSTKSPQGALLAVYRARTMLAMFLRDPVPYLFDGGALTEIAQLADSELWLSRLRASAGEKLTALDQLINDVEFQKACKKLEEAPLVPVAQNTSDGLNAILDGLTE